MSGFHTLTNDFTPTSNLHPPQQQPRRTAIPRPVDAVSTLIRYRTQVSRQQVLATSSISRNQTKKSDKAPPGFIDLLDFPLPKISNKSFSSPIPSQQILQRIPTESRINQIKPRDQYNIQKQPIQHQNKLQNHLQESEKKIECIAVDVDDDDDESLQIVANGFHKCLSILRLLEKVFSLDKPLKLVHLNPLNRLEKSTSSVSSDSSATKKTKLSKKSVDDFDDKSTSTATNSSILNKNSDRDTKLCWTESEDDDYSPFANAFSGSKLIWDDDKESDCLSRQVSISSGDVEENLTRAPLDYKVKDLDIGKQIVWSDTATNLDVGDVGGIYKEHPLEVEENRMMMPAKEIKPADVPTYDHKRFDNLEKKIALMEARERILEDENRDLKRKRDSEEDIEKRLPKRAWGAVKKTVVVALAVFGFVVVDGYLAMSME